MFVRTIELRANRRHINLLAQAFHLEYTDLFCLFFLFESELTRIPKSYRINVLINSVHHLTLICNHFSLIL